MHAISRACLAITLVAVVAGCGSTTGPTAAPATPSPMHDRGIAERAGHGSTDGRLESGRERHGRAVRERRSVRVPDWLNGADAVAHAPLDRRHGHPGNPGVGPDGNRRDARGPRRDRPRRHRRRRHLAVEGRAGLGADHRTRACRHRDRCNDMDRRRAGCRRPRARSGGRSGRGHALGRWPHVDQGGRRRGAGRRSDDRCGGGARRAGRRGQRTRARQRCGVGADPAADPGSASTRTAWRLRQHSCGR